MLPFEVNAKKYFLSNEILFLSLKAENCANHSVKTSVLAGNLRLGVSGGFHSFHGK